MQELSVLDTNERQAETRIISSGELMTNEQKELKEWILESIKTDPDNLSAVRPEVLKIQIEEGLVFIAMEGDKFIGFVRAIPTEKFCTISTTYVDQDYRGKGIGKELLTRAMNRFPDKWQYLETQNAQMETMASNLGFEKLETVKQMLPAAGAIIRSNMEQMLGDPRAYFSGFFSSKSQGGDYSFMLKVPAN